MNRRNRLHQILNEKQDQSQIRIHCLSFYLFLWIYEIWISMYLNSRLLEELKWKNWNLNPILNLKSWNWRRNLKRKIRRTLLVCDRCSRLRNRIERQREEKGLSVSRFGGEERAITTLLSCLDLACYLDVTVSSIGIQSI